MFRRSAVSSSAAFCIRGGIGLATVASRRRKSSDSGGFSESKTTGCGVGNESRDHHRRAAHGGREPRRLGIRASSGGRMTQCPGYE